MAETNSAPGILDDTGRPMVLINWNTDIGDGMQWSNAEDYPVYVTGPRSPAG